MVPSAFVTLEALPLTPNGKVDRKALPAPEARRLRRGLACAPQGPVEELLAGIWAEVLGLEPGRRPRQLLRPRRPLAAGHAGRLADARTAFGVELPLRRLFEAPDRGGPGPRGRGGAASRAGGEAPPLAPRAAARATCRSPSPRSGSGSSTSSSRARRPTTCRRRCGWRALSTSPALARCFAELVRRHEALRTVFAAVDGQPVQVIHPAGAVRAAADRSARISRRRSARRSCAAAAWTRRGGRSTSPRGPLLRAHAAAAWPSASTRCCWRCTTSSPTAGRWRCCCASWRRSTRPSPRGAPRRCRSCRSSTRTSPSGSGSWLRGEVLARQLAYWRERLAGAPPLLELPTDRPRPAVQSFRRRAPPAAPAAGAGAVAGGLRPPRGADAVHGAAGGVPGPAGAATPAQERRGGRHADRQPHPARDRGADRLLRQHAGAAHRPGGRSRRSASCCGGCASAALGAYAHQDLPFEQLVEELQPERDLSHPPLFQVMFVLQNAPAPEVGSRGACGCCRWPADRGQAPFDLTLTLMASGARAGSARSSTRPTCSTPRRSRAGRATCEVLLRGIAAAPGAPALGAAAADRRRSGTSSLVGVERHGASPGRPEPCVHELFAAQAARHAGGGGGGSRAARRLTYGELDARANRLARRLRRLGVGPEARVGLCVERSPEMVVALLGILKAGGAYVPLDPSHPAERLALMLADSAVPVLVTEERLLGALAGARRVGRLPRPGRRRDRRRERPGRLERLARRGEPGLRDLHLGLDRPAQGGAAAAPGGGQLPARHGRAARAARGRRAAGADHAVVRHRGSGALPAPRRWAAGWRWSAARRPRTARGWRARLATCGATVVQATPATWRLLLDAGWQGIAGPEGAVRRRGAAARPGRGAARPRGVALWNVYGPTETTVWSAAGEVAPGEGPVPLGRPIANTAALRARPRASARCRWAWPASC